MLGQHGAIFKNVCTICGLLMAYIKNKSGTQQVRVNFLYSDVAEVTGQSGTKTKSKYLT